MHKYKMHKTYAKMHKHKKFINFLACLSGGNVLPDLM